MANKFNVKKIKEILLKRRTDLMSSNISSTEFSRNASDEVKDTGDEAYLASTMRIQYTLGETQTSEIKLIDQALEKLEKGGYGICVDCGGEISQSRLEYYPYALRCVVCQEASSA